MLRDRFDAAWLERFQQTIGGIWRVGGVSISGLWLLIIYTVTTFLVILSLTAFQVQGKIKSFRDGERTYSLGEMLRLFEPWYIRENEIERATKDVEDARNQLASVTKDLEQARLNKDQDLVRYLVQEHRINRILAEAENRPVSDWSELTVDEVLEIVTQETPPALPDLNENPVYDDFMTAVEDVRNSDNQFQTTQATAEQAQERLIAAENRLAEIVKGSTIQTRTLDPKFPTTEEKQATKLIPEYPAAVLADSKSSLEVRQENLNSSGVQDLLNKLIFLRRFLGGWTYNLVTMPAELLTLILTLSMGALGSVIFLTRQFLLDPTKEKFSWFLFRPFLGMITALAVFILAKAGVLVIADSTQSGGSPSDLNPFFISFLAIISGMLSDHATRRIQAAGENLFRSESNSGAQDQQYRWALRVKQEMDQQNRTPQELAQFVDADEAMIMAWIEERKPVPDNIQDVFAAWLNKSKRNLFTDLSPPQQPAAETTKF